LIDWDKARARLAEAKRRTEEALDPPQSVVTRQLEERARRLAQRPPAPMPRSLVDALVFTLSDETFAIPLAFVREVVPLTTLTPLPGAPPPFLGVTSFHGEVLLLVDVRAHLGLAALGLPRLSQIIAIGASRAELGLLADRLDGVHLVEPTAVSPRWLDGNALLNDSRFSLHDERAAP